MLDFRLELNVVQIKLINIVFSFVLKEDSSFNVILIKKKQDLMEENSINDKFFSFLIFLNKGQNLFVLV